ncbi:MAG: 50S ribosomal protein L5 [Deltaproteobacteria bacterium]|nr:50S ribosomal protein L5 [Deltaproteobacteria bacterium]
MASHDEKDAKAEGAAPEKHDKADKPDKGDKHEKHDKKQKGEGGEHKHAKGDGEKEGKKQKGEGGDKKKGDKGEAKKEKRQVYPKVIPRMFTRYKAEIVPLLMGEFKYSSAMQVPRLKKITLNMGLGEAVSNPNIIKTAVEELTQIAGQKAVITRSKKSIANFKLRAGLAIGCMVTLRRERMWEFMDRLVSVAIPRVRDFKGVSGKAFDGRGNYSLGLREQTIFPEINYDKVEKVKGLNVTFTTTARTDEEGKALLKHLGMPFRA